MAIATAIEKRVLRKGRSWGASTTAGAEGGGAFANACECKAADHRFALSTRQLWHRSRRHAGTCRTPEERRRPRQRSARSLRAT
jgi:hypothetical protein